MEKIPNLTDNVDELKPNIEAAGNTVFVVPCERSL